MQLLALKVSILSLIVSGLGHMYLRKFKKGLLFLASVYSLVVIDYRLFVVSVTSHHVELSLPVRLLWMSPMLVAMLTIPFWIYLLIYGLIHSLNSVPLILLAPPEYIALISAIITLWILQAVEAHHLSRKCLMRIKE